ncbi:MAG: protein arginine kinase [Gemmatimonadota bacterium]
MIRFDTPVADRGIQWLEEDGPDRDIVLSTRVRVARNLQGVPFSIRASAEDRAQVRHRVEAALTGSGALGEADLWNIADLEPTERSLLVERHLVSRELVGTEDGPAPPGAALALSRAATTGLMVNEEDHLRLQSLAGGLQLEVTWRRVDGLDEELGQHLPYAFHHEFGFLTSCPTNAGTGLRASVLIHLAGLVLTKEIARVLQGISQVGLTYRGLYGEGSQVIGNFFQLSNQTTLGKSEEELIDHLAKIVRRVIEYERNARAVLVREAPAVLEDKVWRAYGILRHARSLPADELMNLLSGLRLGLTLKLLQMPRVETLNRIMVFAQRAHLERAQGRKLEDAEADVLRASYVRSMLSRDESAAEAASGES